LPLLDPLRSTETAEEKMPCIATDSAQRWVTSARAAKPYHADEGQAEHILGQERPLDAVQEMCSPLTLVLVLFLGAAVWCRGQTSRGTLTLTLSPRALCRWEERLQDLQGSPTTCWERPSPTLSDIPLMSIQVSPRSFLVPAPRPGPRHFASQHKEGRGEPEGAEPRFLRLGSWERL